MVLDTKLEGARYQRLLEVIRKVTRIYNFSEVRAFEDCDKVFNLTDDYFNARTLENDFLKHELVLLSSAILKGLGISCYSIYSKELNNYNSLKELEPNIKYDETIRYDYEIKVNDIYLGEANDNTLKLSLNELLKANEIYGKRLVVPNVLHCFFVYEGKKSEKEILKIMNVCRIGGLISESSSLDKPFDSLFTCYLTDELLNDFKINIIDNKNDSEELISIYDVYPYIINKLNKNNSCSSCKEAKK